MFFCHAFGDAPHKTIPQNYLNKWLRYSTHLLRTTITPRCTFKYKAIKCYVFPYHAFGDLRSYTKPKITTKSNGQVGCVGYLAPIW